METMTGTFYLTCLLAGLCMNPPPAHGKELQPPKPINIGGVVDATVCFVRASMGFPVPVTVEIIETTMVERFDKDGKPYLVKVVVERGEELIEPSLPGSNEGKDLIGLE